MRRRCAFLAGLLVLLGGCATHAVSAEPADPAVAYNGPLVLKSDQARTRLEREAGAAGRVVQCRTDGRGGTNQPSGYGGEVGETPAKGLQEAIDEGSISGPPRGWHPLRAEDDRALFVVTAGGLRKAAVVMRRGAVTGDQFGWYAETFAFCNLAEFDPIVAEDVENEVWTDSTGRPVSTWVVVSSRGPEHCGWTAVTFLDLDEGALGDRGGSTYLRHPEPEWVGEYVAEPSQDHVALPASAVDTGFRRDGKALWLSADGRRAYVGSPDAAQVEMWPRTIQPLGCA